MSLNEDLVQPTNDSFWEIGKYSRTVKRIDNGKALCDSLRQLIQQRSEIETSYAKNLTNWSKKWNDFLDRGNEYGTIQAGWRGMLQEADSLADLHSLVAENLMTKDYASIKAWQKENYHKSMMHFKETKELDEGFKKAQKPWEKKYTKVMQAKKDYHSACRAEKSTANQENNARGDSAVSPDQLKKIQEKLRKCQLDVESTRDKYEASLNDLNSYNAKYIEDMNEVFQKCQDFESTRIEFFKKTMFEIHQHLDMSVEPRFSQVYSNLHSTVGQIDSDKDLRWWSTNHGADMPMNWPNFEEYSPELQNISKKKDSQLGGNDGITITSIRHKPDGFVQQSESYNSQRQTPTELQRSSSGSNHQPPPPQQQQQQQQQSSTLSKESENKVEAAVEEEETNPFADDVDEPPSPSPEDSPRQVNGKEGVPVRALYDYVVTEEDELPLKAGDVFVKLSEEDELGWCKGYKDGREGLYPANYVEAV
ncbi:protein kinase C and casein kinase substrate in neurons protein 1-like isoform X4 [Ostrea edulis]|uniref:protein kinase C and casein kinase substrate in neurons protein 1-like isoform X4 n=1 Tax=Ostrea edulis TaxID=37623 RepID=UPI0024AF89C7|nr:protein kinase C and casein kinase substrate in neurons protein 1-like isoform X4 [Ostrea edulis]XP_055996253.1 protein kinase C and casein kinase substrate in neurons protein 1-like isoform X4 [Ostrea edulis]XP_055996254.1 protein kinase C and casein kinase substrate in neurons protein 1-like isoform X4 [Ostrea edulis]